jgi:hypothetical protein
MDGVVAWRIARLRGAGCSAPLANSLAHDNRYDLHELLGLIDRGCPAELAARILAPLDDEVEEQRSSGRRTSEARSEASG